MKHLTCDAIHTPMGHYTGARCSVRSDDLDVILISAFMAGNPIFGWEAFDVLI